MRACVCVFTDLDCEEYMGKIGRKQVDSLHLHITECDSTVHIIYRDDTRGMYPMRSK